jgi:hypothetical protein
MALGGGLGTLGFWIFITAVVVVPIVTGIWYSIRMREAQHETLRRMAESGQPLDQALMDQLLGVNKHLDRDLKVAGLIVLFIAPGLALLGWLVSLLSPPWLFPTLGAAALVACVGIGLLVASKFVER